MEIEMRKDKNEAFKLRIEGKSYSEISKYLNIPKSTLSYWLRGVAIDPIKKEFLMQKSNKAGIKALLKRNKLQTKTAKERAYNNFQSASQEINKLNFDILRVIGSSLYFAEGGKTPNRVDFTNSNPFMIQIMMKFFRKICDVEEGKFRIQLAIHNKEKEQDAKKYWSEITGLSLSQFIKSNLIISKYSKKRRRKKLPFGTIQIRIANVNLFHKIQGWTQGIIQQIDNMPG